LTAAGYSIRLNEKVALAFIVIVVFVLGIYPNLFLDITKETSDFILQKADVSSLLIK
jgi:NADH:ubiquinone oxidoreductase subunit 4 (subunit M)